MIGIGVTTTPNRDVLNMAAWKRYMPESAKFVVYEDTKMEGVAKAKNHLLAQLDDCDHIILADDDVVPLRKGWELPYIHNEEPHLMFLFDLPNKPRMRLLHADGIITAWSHTRGCMLYIERRVLDVVGGFDIKYGLYGFEHPDWTNRIYNAGLTTYRAQDVAGSDKLLKCLDQDGKVDSSIPARTRRDMLQRNYRYYKSQKGSSAYKEYRK